MDLDGAAHSLGHGSETACVSVVARYGSVLISAQEVVEAGFESSKTATCLLTLTHLRLSIGGVNAADVSLPTPSVMCLFARNVAPRRPGVKYGPRVDQAAHARGEGLSSKFGAVPEQCPLVT